MFALRELSLLPPTPDKLWVFWEPWSSIYTEPHWQAELTPLSENLKKLGHNIIVLWGETESELNSIELQKFQSSISGQALGIYVFPSYQRISKQDLLKKSKEILLFGAGITKSTIEHFERMWTYHYARNLLRENPTYLFQKLDHKGKPVVFVGASPELEKEILELKSRKNSVYLIVGDTAIQFVLAHGMEPDLILSIDSGRGTLFHFLPSLPKHIPICTWFGAHPYLFSLENPLLLVRTTHPLDQLFGEWLYSQKQMDWPEIANPGNNQATLAKELALFSGSSIFSYAGVSFLGEAGKSHCRGTGYESYRLPLISRKNSWEGLHRPLYGATRAGKNSKAWKVLQETSTNMQSLAWCDLGKQAIWGEGEERKGQRSGKNPLSSGERGIALPNGLGKVFGREAFQTPGLFLESIAGVSQKAFQRLWKQF